MPKTIRDIWPRVTCFDNLVAAWEDARRGKRFLPSVLKFSGSVEENLLDIQGRLLHRTWRPGPWREFISNDPKPRLIQAPQFGDRVVHHALVRVIGPAFERRFINDSYACRKGLGNLSASDRLTDFLRASTSETRKSGRKIYALKADVRKYFPNIDHDILLGVLKRTVGDEGALWLIEKIVKDNGFEQRGLPIGALTSQLFANAYLDVLDHYVKDELGVRFYVRYMDDFIILHTDKRHLHDLQTLIGSVLWERLKLQFNPKTSIFPASHGIDLAGYRHWVSYRLPRKRNIKRTRRKFKEIRKLYAEGRMDVAQVRSRVASFVGYTKHCKASRTVKGVLDELVLQRGGGAE